MQANSRSTESESYDPRQRRRRAGRTIALLLAALAIPAAIAGAVALGGGDSGGGSDDPAPDSSYTAEPLEGDGFGTNVLETRNAHGASAVEPARGQWRLICPSYRTSKLSRRTSVRGTSRTGSRRP